MVGEDSFLLVLSGVIDNVSIERTWIAYGQS